MTPARICDALPVYGELAVPFPTRFGTTGRQGVVVEFDVAGGRWTGNFQPGIGGLTAVQVHPDGHRLLFFANGDVWIVEPRSRAGHLFMSAIDAVWSLGERPRDVEAGARICSPRTARTRVAHEATVVGWIRQRAIEATSLSALAWSPVDDQWHSCTVNLETGSSAGGSYSEVDTENWERLALESG